MKFDSNYRGSQRADYEQFAKFLSGRRANADNNSCSHNNDCNHNHGCLNNNDCSHNHGCSHNNDCDHNHGCNHNHGCDHNSDCSHNHGCEQTICGTRPIAMVYGISQEWKNLYDIELGLSYGTVFEELNLPLEKTGCSGGRGCRG
ncbi:MAG: spore coat associated protein CotJA [Clostridia bacterium]|nr:spore coat associated protein CotJA [Clostridia bacterium]